MTYDGSVTLGELVDALETMPFAEYMQLCFDNPHSYRVYYECIAFEPCSAGCYTSDEVLAAARNSIGQTYTGWKGGDFEMGRKTSVFMAVQGNTGWPLTPELLRVITSSGEGDKQ